MTLGLDQADTLYMSDVVQICLIFHPPQLHLKTTRKNPPANPGVSCEVYSAPFSCDGRTNKAPLLSWMQKIEQKIKTGMTIQLYLGKKKVLKLAKGLTFSRRQTLLNSKRSKVFREHLRSALIQMGS